MIKKRNEVKSLKIVGDYALLAGDYNDAIIRYIFIFICVYIDYWCDDMICIYVI